MRTTADASEAAALSFAGLCAGAGLAALFRGAGPASMLLGGAAGALLTSRAQSPRDSDDASESSRGAERDLLERLAPFTALIFFLPIFTMAVAPGIDMSMHAALARSLADGAHDLSPAWPGISPAIYPRGFSALMALLSPFGLARASLIASAISLALYQWGAARLFAAAGAQRPSTLGALVAILSRTPQSWFSWGGDPTALALGLGFFAAALVSPKTARPRWRATLAASLLLAGAGAVHPIGSLAAALALVALALYKFAALNKIRSSTRSEQPPDRSLHDLLPALIALASLGAVLIATASFGPSLSPRELDWMVGYARGTEAIVRGAPWQFPLRIWLALGPVLGDAWTISAALGAVYLLLRARRMRDRRDAILVARCLAAVLFLGALLAIGPYLPTIGAYLYPSRFAPLLALATAALFDRSLERIREGGLGPPAGKVAAAITLGLFAAALPVHIRNYQRAEPLASFADLRAIDCIAARTPQDAVIEGPNGDAAEWIPALTGRRVTEPHKHCSLFDEIDIAIAQLHPGYRFHGEEARYGESLPEPANAGAPLCAEGKARLWKIPFAPR